MRRFCGKNKYKDGEGLPITYVPPGQTTVILCQWEVTMGKLVKAREDPPLSQGEIPASALLLTSLRLSTVSSRPCPKKAVHTAGPSGSRCGLQRRGEVSVWRRWPSTHLMTAGGNGPARRQTGPEQEPAPASRS